MMASKAYNLPPQWVQTQDIDTINYIEEESKKMLDLEMQFKKLMIKASMPGKMF